MSCAVCNGKGVVLVNWAEAPESAPDEPQYAICLCSTGREMRGTRNAGKPTAYALWHVWCAREGVNPSQIVLLEDVLTADELQARGFGPAAPEAPLDAIAAAARATREKARL